MMIYNLVVCESSRRFTRQNPPKPKSTNLSLLFVWSPMSSRIIKKPHHAQSNVTCTCTGQNISILRFLQLDPDRSHDCDKKLPHDFFADLDRPSLLKSFTLRSKELPPSKSIRDQKYLQKSGFMRTLDAFSKLFSTVAQRACDCARRDFPAGQSGVPSHSLKKSVCQCWNPL